MLRMSILAFHIRPRTCRFCITKQTYHDKAHLIHITIRNTHITMTIPRMKKCFTGYNQSVTGCVSQRRHVVVTLGKLI